MTECGCNPDTIEDGRIVISELVGNAVRHARPLPDGTLLVCWTPEVAGIRISVSDGGSATRPHKVNASSSALAGRGLTIIDSLALSWWDDRTHSRTTVNAIVGFC
jgi:anti-sigma regulatory factor (Ser/Thr protein kinase)